MSTLIEDRSAPADRADPEVRRRRQRRRTDRSPGSASVYTYIAIVIVAALLLVPFLWLFLTAIATPGQLAQGAAGILRINPQWSNFVEAVTRADYPAYFMNSVLLSTLTSVLTTSISALVGFGFARLRGRGQKVLFTIVLGTMMIPSIATLIPTYILFSRVGFVGTYWPWVAWGLAGAPYLIFLFRQFFTAIPIELEDAAIIDGCGWWRIFLRVFLPLARPVILTSLLLSFTWAWGDYLAPALLLNADNTTLAVATAVGYLDPRGNGILTLQAAGALLYLVPVLVIFLFAQRHFIGSALGSGVKG